MLLDLLEGAVDRFVVGDVAHDPEKPLGGTRSTVCDGNFVAVGREALSDRKTDAAIATGDQY